MLNVLVWRVHACVAAMQSGNQRTMYWSVLSTSPVDSGI